MSGKVDQQLLTDRILDRLNEDPRVDAAQAVDVKVNRALVTLRGSVPTVRARREAFLAALNMEGVVDVRDELRVAPPEDSSDVT